MTEILEQLRARAAGAGSTVVLPEALDTRTLQAATQAVRTNLCHPQLVGDPDAIRGVAEEASSNLSDIDLSGIEILDPKADPRIDQLETILDDLLQTRQMPAPAPVAELVRDPLYYAGLQVYCGDADGAVMGAVATTADTLRAALRTVGVDPRYKVVTSCFLMSFPDKGEGERNLVYADCGVIPEPNAEQLADITMQAADAYQTLTGDTPRVALLAFSTLGSAKWAGLDKIRDAVRLLGERNVTFAFDGELQGDAALVPEVAARKAPDSSVAGQANVLVFPDLNSGNIAYKLSERLAGARAIGPLLCGLDRPIHDLSRGCSAEDIVDTMAITALEAARRRT